MRRASERRAGEGVDGDVGGDGWVYVCASSAMGVDSRVRGEEVALEAGGADVGGGDGSVDDGGE